MFLVTSCVDDSSGGNSGTNNWRTGIEGITMSLVPDNPPSEVLSSGKVHVILKYANKGASSAAPFFYLTGYDPNILSFSNPYVQAPAIGGKDQYNSVGSQEAFVQWEAPINMNSLFEVDNFKQALSVTTCYAYETIAYPMICIDPQKYNYVEASSCDYSIKDLGSSQGGPIGVTQVKQKSTGDEVFLEIHFQNKGKGTPYISNGNCLNLRHDEVDMIYLSSVSMSSGSNFVCEPQAIRLINNEGYAVCRKGLDNKNSYYESPLKIQVRYNYRDTLPKKEITIVNVNRK